VLGGKDFEHVNVNSWDVATRVETSNKGGYSWSKGDSKLSSL